jgi:Rrf2 family protein
LKISTKGRYGLRALIDLAVHSKGDYVSLGSIAARQDLSINYLENTFSSLKKAGLINGLTGANGGYKLAYDPESITVQMVLYILEGDLSIVQNVKKSEESPLQACIREKLWDRINDRIKALTSATTLKDMMDGYGKLPDGSL